VGQRLAGDDAVVGDLVDGPCDVGVPGPRISDELEVACGDRAGLHVAGVVPDSERAAAAQEESDTNACEGRALDHLVHSSTYLFPWFWGLPDWFDVLIPCPEAQGSAPRRRKCGAILSRSLRRETDVTAARRVNLRRIFGKRWGQVCDSKGR